jgi:hypothetical protein
MVDGSRPLTVASATMVLVHLNKCADIPVNPQDRRMPRPAGTQRPEPAAAPPAQTGPLPTLREFGDIPEGYYATPSAPGNNDIDFWRVDRPSKGKWAGCTFAVRILGGGDDSKMRTVRLANIQQRLALHGIRSAGIETAGNLFADNLRRCRKCGIVLTDEISRAARMGPDCRSKSS